MDIVLDLGLAFKRLLELQATFGQIRVESVRTFVTIKVLCDHIETQVRRKDEDKWFNDCKDLMDEFLEACLILAQLSDKTMKEHPAKVAPAVLEILQRACCSTR
jgi:hypothetical protein